MVKVATYFAMSFGAFLFWQSMDKLHVWIALHQDEKFLYYVVNIASWSLEVHVIWFLPRAVKASPSAQKERLEREMGIKRVRDELLAQAKEKDSYA